MGSPAQPDTGGTKYTEAANAGVPGVAPPGMDPTDPQSGQYRDLNQQYDNEITVAKSNYQNAYQRFTDAQSALKAAQDAQASIGAPPTPGQPASTLLPGDAAARVTAAQAAVDKAQADVTNAGQDWQAAVRNKADGLAAFYKTLKTPQDKAQVAAAIDLAQQQAAAAKLQNQYDAETDPLKKQQLQQQLDQGNANLKVAQANLDAQTLQNQYDAETNPIKKQQLQTQLEAAQQQVEQAKQTQQATVRTANANASISESNAAISQANAANAPDTAAANLAQLQANARKAQLDVQQLQQQINATSDADAKRDIQLKLDQAQATLDSTNQQIAASQATVQQAQQGTQYGLEQKITQIQGLIAKGILTPADGDKLLAAAKNEAAGGPTLAQQDTNALQARQQDITQGTSQQQAFGSLLGNAFNVAAGLHSLTPGDGASAAALAHLMGAFTAKQAQTTVPAFVAPSQQGATTTIAPDGSVTIQHAPQAAAAPVVAPAVPGASVSAAPASGGATPAMMASLLAPGVAGTPNDPTIQADTAGYRLAHPATPVAPVGSAYGLSPAQLQGSAPPPGWYNFGPGQANNSAGPPPAFMSSLTGG